MINPQDPTQVAATPMLASLWLPGQHGGFLQGPPDSREHQEQHSVTAQEIPLTHLIAFDSTSQQGLCSDTEYLAHRIATQPPQLSLGVGEETGATGPYNRECVECPP